MPKLSALFAVALAAVLLQQVKYVSYNAMPIKFFELLPAALLPNYIPWTYPFSFCCSANARMGRRLAPMEAPAPEAEVPPSGGSRIVILRPGKICEDVVIKAFDYFYRW